MQLVNKRNDIVNDKINKLLGCDTCEQREFEKLHFVFVKRIGALVVGCIALLWWLG